MELVVVELSYPQNADIEPVFRPYHTNIFYMYVPGQLGNKCPVVL